MIRKMATTLFTVLVLAGCATTAQNQQESGQLAAAAAPAPREVDGGKANETVKIFVDAHDTVMSEFGNIKKSNKQLMTELGDARSSNQQVVTELAEIKAANRLVAAELADGKASGKQALETAQRSLQIIEEMSKRQGTGEITIFFPNNSAVVENQSLEFQRLVNFADFLSRESRGRKIILLSIGSASSTGKMKSNLELARKRSEMPLDILDKYLVNIPHQFHKVYGTGDHFSPRDVPMKEHQRYQQARIIALFDAAQAPAVNEEAKAETR